VNSVVISGASTGIGRAAALHLDELGWQVFAGVRKDADAESLAGAGSDRLVPITLDVTDDEGVASAAAEVAAAVGEEGLQGLVNNAGIAVGGPLEFVPVEDIRDGFEVNVFGLLRATQAFLPLIRRGHGRVVNVSSQGGRIAAPMFGPYCASKHAVEAISDSLRRELAPWGLLVAVVQPGAIDTAIWAKGADEFATVNDKLDADARTLYAEGLRALRRRMEDSAARGIPPLQVALAIGHALTSERPRIRYAVGSDAKAGIWGQKWLGDRAMDRLVAREFAKQ